MNNGKADDEKNVAKPQKMPAETYYPFCFAFSLLLVALGILTIWIIALAGVAGMAISLAGWVKEMLYD